MLSMRTASVLLPAVTPLYFLCVCACACRSITTFKTLDEAIELANDSEYGLASAIFSKDAEKCERFAREVRAGVVWQNNSQPSPHAMPWGGFKKSGFGREMGPMALLPFLEMKSVTGWPAGQPVGWYPPTHFTA